MNAINAGASGQFRIGDITVNRLGYGAMRFTGRGSLATVMQRKSEATTDKLGRILQEALDPSS